MREKEKRQERHERKVFPFFSLLQKGRLKGRLKKENERTDAEI